ncbi:uncharacterized protein LOC125145769 isoform X1 [Tachysurus fulvidraco]|uniref:uncharacterized protein LOC125145769 isoform X1 n=1 Tax=Tachysurus fulvidraco TaxID=1234273 RepID=UPI001FEFCEC9|nr:uncharacterized protein LOC125145769 isoform X1 [Tachysurus fulvidraco]
MFSGGCVLDMAEFLSGFNLQLMIGVISLSLLQNISADLLSVDPGENVTLFCNITDYSEISWYHINSAGVRQIISTSKGNLDNLFQIVHNDDKSHFAITEISSSVSLVIIGVRDTDLGFYYCGGRKKEHNQFGKVISLNFTGGSNKIAPSPDSQQVGGNGNCWIIVLCTMIVILVMTICMCVFCCRIQGKLNLSCCSHSTDSTEKEENIHYASVQYKRKFRSANNNSRPDLDSVTYATVASQPQRH